MYENEDDATKDLAEFSLANAIYAALVEGHACEQSARYVDCSNSLFNIIFFLPCSSSFYLSQTAMDNASKNAKDMIGSLQMKYNRGRQAAITNELVDIITGKFKIFLLVIPSLDTPSNLLSATKILSKWDFFGLTPLFTGASALWDVCLHYKHWI